MASIDIQMDASGLASVMGRLVTELDAAISGPHGAMDLSVDLVVADARTRAPQSPGAAADGAIVDAGGNLRRSIGGVFGGSFADGTCEGTVSASAPYALHVEYGTRAHVIKPHTKKALRWASGGGRNGWAFAKSVQHPGTAAQPFLRPALAGNRDAIVNRFSVATRLAIARAKAGNR